MSVDFDPVRVRPRRRRFDPLVVGVVIIGVALIAAIVKPWEAAKTDVALASPSTIATGSAPAPSTASTPTTRPSRPVAARPPIWADIAPSLTVHDRWGVRAILATASGGAGLPSTQPYVDRWAPAIISTASGVDTAAIDTEPGAPVVALGVTYPAGTAPQDARIWRVHRNDALEWMDARSPDPARVVFLRPGLGTASYEPWPPGSYRIDVLAADGIHRIAADLPGPSGRVPPPDVRSVELRGLVTPAESDPSSIRVGLFATVDGLGVSLPAPEAGPLDEDAAWRDVVRAGGDVVATAYLPRATGLGVMLTPNAVVERATLDRIAPKGPFTAPRAQSGISESKNQTPDVYFAAPDAAPWPPGVYAITVSWTDATGSHTGTWHVELRPGTS